MLEKIFLFIPYSYYSPCDFPISSLQILITYKLQGSGCKSSECTCKIITTECNSNTGFSVHVDFHMIVRFFLVRLLEFFQRCFRTSKKSHLFFMWPLCCWWKHKTWSDWHTDCPGTRLYDWSSCASNDSWWFTVLISCLWLKGCFPWVSNNKGKQDGKYSCAYQFIDWANS